ncbi:hypothetical protein J2W51_001995 [Tardiphaga robiniae]|jgi:hypothetical protein|nr:hypothetical protein [Tardiphaga robiniae]
MTMIEHCRPLLMTALNSQCERCQLPTKLGGRPVLYFGFEMLQDEETDGRG